MEDKVLELTQEELFDIIRKAVNPEKEEPFNGGVVCEFDDYTVRIHTDDTIKAPHVHIYDSNEVDLIAISLERPEVIPHPTIQNNLTHEQMVKFDDVIRSNDGLTTFETNYAYAVDSWNRNNNDSFKSSTIPTYREIR